MFPVSDAKDANSAVHCDNMGDIATLQKFVARAAVRWHFCTDSSHGNGIAVRVTFWRSA
jgi:hypothetical protein